MNSKKRTRGKRSKDILPKSWEWDRWQQEILDHQGNITLRSGRQVGKSEVIARKAFDFAINHPKTVTMIIAASQRQSSLLFEKVRGNFEIYERENKKSLFEDKPTQTRIRLTNGSVIHSLPAGRTGHFIRGFTLDMLIADEAAFIGEQVWLSILPTIAVSRKRRGMGYIILLSTPFGKGGYFYHSFTDKDFRQWHVSSEDCPRIDRGFLAKERKRMTKAEYRQEYLGEFTDEWNQFFPTQLIKECMTLIEWHKDKHYHSSRRYYLGVDIARYGGDENAFIIAELDQERIKIVVCETTDRISSTDTIGRIEVYDREYRFNKIFIDDSGVGGAVYDLLFERLGRKVIGLNNASKRIEIQGKEKQRGIFKEDLYSNALTLMEIGRCEIVSDLSLLRSLKSITYEYGQLKSGERAVKIYGDYAHLAEAFVRACWCIKEKGLNLYVF